MLQPRGAAVLIVDDNQVIRSTLEVLLRDEGYTVTVAEDGRMAREAVRRARPDVVLLDLMLPAVSGWDLLREWQRAGVTANVAVIVMSAALGLEEEAARLLALGARACLPKPFDLDDLLLAVEGCIGVP